MLYHWDGTAWSRMQSGTSSKINSLAYIGSKLFGAADYGTIVRGP